MNESLRQHYLQALGIESYVPRWVLPGAAESPLLVPEPDEPDAEAVPPLAAESEARAPESAPPAVVKSGAGELLKQAVAPQRSGRKPVDADNAPKAQVHQFALNYWRVGADIAVLDSRQAGAALPTEQLLLNIGAALDIPHLSLAPATAINWPPPGAATTTADPGQSVSESRAMLQAFLAAQHEKQPLRAALLMGAAAVYHGLSEAELGEASPSDRAALTRILGQRFALSLRHGASEAAPVQEVEAIALPGLAAMLKNPTLKAGVWKALKHLRQRH
jgi:hypothetical protein